MCVGSEEEGVLRGVLVEKELLDEEIAVVEMRQSASYPDVIERLPAGVHGDSGQAQRVVGEDLPLLNEPALDAIDIQLLDPLAGDVHVVIVEIPTLEGLKGQIGVADHDLLNLVEIVRADV